MAQAEEAAGAHAEGGEGAGRARRAQRGLLHVHREALRSVLLAFEVLSRCFGDRFECVLAFS